MKQKTKEVYYCDHCNKHGLRKDVIVKHENACYYNPENKHNCYGCIFLNTKDWVCMAQNKLKLKSRSLSVKDVNGRHKDREVMPKLNECPHFMGIDTALDKMQGDVSDEFRDIVEDYFKPNF